ncbi:MAG: hypothetical protein H6872_00235 [Methylobacteriaceae bacterium]|nr:hypothetical protein [Rhodoblastus sp.]MCC0003637.1 hypothetical protein [Methylobacteriaceae bacterium]
METRVDPTQFVVIAALLLVVLIGVLRPPEGSESELTRDAFWRMKIDQPPVYDMVFAGDSRVLCDVSPKAVAGETGGRVYNFGFNFVGYTREYLDAIESKLDANSQRKTIVLGITPRSLTPLNMAVSGYAEENSREFLDVMGQKYLSYPISTMRPFMLSAIVMHLRGKSTAKNFYRDGLMSVEIKPADINQDLKTYSTIFVGNQVSEPHIAALIDRVRLWRSKGIAVYAFRPPVSPAIFDAEKASAFDQHYFVEQFTNAGGRWIEIDAKGLTLADGSHVTATSVDLFSQRLGRAIRNMPAT